MLLLLLLLLQVARSQADLSNLDEQLAAANGQLQAKSSTIESLVREHKRLEVELTAVGERHRDQQHKYEVLQTEAAAMSRDYLGAMQRLEEQVEHLRQANERLMRGDFSET